MNRRNFAFAGLAGTAAWSPTRALTQASRIKQLRAAVSGPVVVPGDPLYEQARRVQSHNPSTNKFPSIIVGCKSTQDIAAAIRFSVEQDLKLAIQSGGHDVLGQSTVEGGLLIHTGYMDNVDVSKHTVRIGAGVRAGHLNQTLGRHNRVVALGCHPNVGVSGLTLGGGLGWLLGSHGVTCDNVQSFELVLASGNVLHVSADTQPDLFWALKGGGGNFGVVSQIEFHTRQLARVARGFIVYAGAQLEGFMHMYNEYMQQLPRELVVELVLTAGPTPLINLTYCHSSPETFTTDLIRPLLKYGEPLATYADVVPYARLTDIPESLTRRFADETGNRTPPSEPRQTYNFWRGGSCAGWSTEAIAALCERFETAPPSATIGIGHYMHGAACEIDPLSSPLIRRAGTSSYFFNANWVQPVDADGCMNWVIDSLAEQREFAVPTYVNYLSSNESQDIADTYASNIERLQWLKRQYDPGNVFRLNRNIEPLRD